MKYDLDRQLTAIEAFEAQAIKSAEETKQGVDEELRNLERTLENIDEARPFDDLTVVSFQVFEALDYTLILNSSELQDEVVAAQPDIDVRVEQLVSKGIWMPPGYKVRSLAYHILSPRGHISLKMIGTAN